MAHSDAVFEPVDFETHPSRYRHWKVSYDGAIAKVVMDVDPEGGLRPGYELKLNSYDLGVDIELADVVRRMRFEHPEVRVVLLTSGVDRAFCAGANINMLGQSTHAWKVNFCKFTNETRCEIEDAETFSQQIYVAACNGTTAGGGYELALACKEIYLQDDGNSAVSLPEVPLLGVLPGTGGLTRLVDKRHVRRDLADVFSTTAEGVRGKKAVKWGLVDGSYPRSKFDEKILERASELCAQASSDLPGGERKGVELEPLEPTVTDNSRSYQHVRMTWDTTTRIAQLEIDAPTAEDAALLKKGAAAVHAHGTSMWALRAYRELDDALLSLRVNLLDVGLVLVRVKGDPQAVLHHDAALMQAHAENHWFVNEVVAHMARVLRRFDLTSRSFFAMGDAGTAFVGNLFEFALASDRFYLLDSPDAPVSIGVTGLNDGPLAMSHGPARLDVRFLGDAKSRDALRNMHALMAGEDAEDAGLVTVLLDDLDWDDDTRMAVEERASLSPDALTGMEANLRFPGAENADSKIFARLTAWQNWIFIRPNATGPEGALTLYGKPDRPRFDWKRV